MYIVLKFGYLDYTFVTSRAPASAEPYFQRVNTSFSEDKINSDGQAMSPVYVIFVRQRYLIDIVTCVCKEQSGLGTLGLQRMLDEWLSKRIFYQSYK